MPRLKDDTKVNDIYAAARRLVIKTGFAGLKMADVAKEAGVATGSVYTYFASKEDLVNQVYTETKNEVAAVLLDPGHRRDTYYATFRQMWFAYFSFCFSQPEKMLFVEQFLHSGLLTPETLAQVGEGLAPMYDFIRQGQQQGIIRQIDVEIVEAQLMGPIHEIVKYAVLKKVSLPDGTLEQCFDMAWNSLRR